MKVGICCSTYDLCHAGHLLYLKDAKAHCDYLIAMLQLDPSIDRPDKRRPIECLEERMIRLESCKYVDEIKVYTTEQDLWEKLKEINADILFMGTDWKDRKNPIKELFKEIYYHDRTVHTYSSSNLKDRINAKSL
jgi:glycerol-3-phosphate cytidylyltransferase